MSRKLTLSENDWLRIGAETGWLKEAKRYNRVCAWCEKVLGELQDNVEPKDEWGVDTHGLCPSCSEKVIREYQEGKKQKAAMLP